MDWWGPSAIWLLRSLDPLQYKCEILRFCANFCSEIPLQLWNFVWSGNFAGASPSGDTRNFHATWIQGPSTHGMVSHRHKTSLSSRLFHLRSYWKARWRYWLQWFFAPHYPQFLLFSEPSTSAIPDGVAKFFESLSNSSGSRRACWQSKTSPRNAHILSCISRHSNFAARLSWTRSDKSLMRNVCTS